MIHIRFSMEFDSGVWQGPLQKNRATIGEAALGPLGLLDHLETRLGLKSPESPQHQRIIDYLNALKSKSTEPVFYQASLATDPMAVAEHLLYLRDRLIEAGWNQKTVPGIQKTEDLSKVEASFSNRSGIADRIKDVLDSLRSKKSLADPGRITLHDHEKELPFLWREIVLKELPRLGFTIQHAATSSAALAAPDSDLGKFANLRASPAKPTGDGSLLALSGRDPWESARYLSAFLATLSPEELQNTVAIVPPAHRGILLSALQARGIAFGGEHSEMAYSRPALQILILAVALLWEPKDPGVALSLMTLESSPMSKRFRYGMKKSLAGSLDIGGPEWKSALEEVTAGLIEKLEQESPGAEEREKELERVRSRKRRIEEWFHAPAFSVEAGIPLDELKGTCARVSKWLGLMAQVKKQGSLYEAQSASQLLSEYAHSIAEKTITRERLLHLLLDSIGNGVSANVHKAGAGGLRVVESPSAVLEPAERVIWWDFSSASVNSFRETFYSKAEVAALQQQGVQWPDPSDQAVFTANRWRNPVLKAKSSLILVSQWLDARGSESGFHPLLMECIEKNSRNEWFSKILANLLEKESPTVTALLQKAGAVTAKVTGDPSRQRFEWEIAANAAGPRELESASSLEKLLGCELAYVLTYGAKLKGEDREVLQFDGRVTGTIAHEVLAKVFKKGARLKSDEAVRQARELLDEVIRKHAPTLFQKSKASELEGLRTTILRDVRVYADFLDHNGISVVEAEHEVEKSEQTLGGVHLNGTIDHYLRTRDGRALVVDHKLGGSGTKKSLFEEGKSLQLSIYSWLLPKSENPRLSYHMIGERKIFVLNEGFDHAQKVDGPEAVDVIHDANLALKEKLKVLSSGKIRARGLEEDNKKAQFSAPCQYCEYQSICGLQWKEEQS